MRLSSAARLLLLATCTAALACASRSDPEPLRLMTYNIAAGHGDLAAIVAAIRTERPDIVALQEVDVNWSERSGFADQAAVLGAALGMHVRFGPIYRMPTVTDSAAAAQPAEQAPVREFGLAILSRAPIVDFTNHLLPRLSTQTAETEPRLLPGFLEAVIDLGGGLRLHVFNTHLDYRADPRVRVQQVAAMLTVLSERPAALVLMGDLNAPPDASELQPLLARVRDAWSAGHGPGFTFPADSPDRRIDYILHSAHIQMRNVRVTDARASDHRPVVADVLLN